MRTKAVADVLCTAWIAMRKRLFDGKHAIVGAPGVVALNSIGMLQRILSRTCFSMLSGPTGVNAVSFVNPVGFRSTYLSSRMRYF